MLNGHTNGNGHANGHQNGDGKKPILPSSDGNHDRQDVRALCRAALQGWLKTPDDIQWAYTVLKEVAMDPNRDSRSRAQAAKGAGELMQKAVELGLRQAELDDKIRRLDAGEPTENVQEVYKVRMPEARMRIGEPLED